MHELNMWSVFHLANAKDFEIKNERRKKIDSHGNDLSNDESNTSDDCGKVFLAFSMLKYSLSISDHHKIILLVQWSVFSSKALCLMILPRTYQLFKTQMKHLCCFVPMVSIRFNPERNNNLFICFKADYIVISRTMQYNFGIKLLNIWTDECHLK